MTELKDFSKAVEPQWLREVAPNSTLTVKDLMRMFDVCQATIFKKVSQGLFPEIS